MVGWAGAVGLAFGVSSSSVDRRASAAFSRWVATMGSSSSPDPDVRKTESGDVTRGGSVGLGSEMGPGGPPEVGVLPWRSVCLEGCMATVGALADACLRGSSGANPAPSLSTGGFVLSFDAPFWALSDLSGCSGAAGGCSVMEQKDVRVRWWRRG